MKLTSRVFIEGEMIPRKYGRDFENVNPPLTIEDIPQGAASLALFMDDPDVPKTAGVPVWDHWIVFDIPPETTQIPENWIVNGVKGVGTRGELDYGGPRPPDREHRYFFHVFALDTMLNMKEGTTKRGVVEAMRGHILDMAELMGRYAPKIL